MHHFSYVARIFSPFYFLNPLTGFLCGDDLEGHLLHVPKRAAPASHHHSPHQQPLDHQHLHRVGSPKRGRELVEVTFVHKALSLGFEVAKPYDDSECYDFILESQDESPDQPGGGFWRVRVKSTNRFRKGGYVVGACDFSTRGAKQLYSAEQIDVLAVCIVPEETWYVIPVKEFAPREYLSFFPQNTGSKGQFERFREAWHLMGARETVRQ
jgi:hypothetical protein